MIPIIEVAIAAVAAIISILSVRTQRTIKHLGVGKSFWIPVALSGILFIIGSAITILNQTNFSLATIIPMTDEIAQTTRLIALGILLIGVASYSRQVSRNLRSMPETMKLAEKTFTRTTETERETERYTEGETETPTEETEAPAEEPRPLPVAELPIQERLDQPEYKVQIPQACRHEFGYLRTLPKDTAIPDECLSCNRIVECRHVLPKTLEPRASARLNPA